MIDVESKVSNDSIEVNNVVEDFDEALVHSSNDSNASYQFMLTTVDNPFDPFEDFDNWFHYDCEKGYYSCSILARITNLPHNLSEIEIERETEKAIDEFVKNDVLDLFKKVSKKLDTA